MGSTIEKSVDINSFENKRLVRAHLQVFKTALELHIAVHRGTAEVRDEKVMSKSLIAGEITNATRLVVEDALFNALENDTTISRTPSEHVKTWTDIGKTAHMVLSKSINPALGAVLNYSLTKVERPAITNQPLFKFHWTLSFNDLTTEVKFSVMGYIKPNGPVNLGIVFLSSEGAD